MKKKNGLNCKGSRRTLAMACPIKKEKIKEKKGRKEQEEREKMTKPYNEVIMKSIQETQNKVAPTQLVLSKEHSYKITKYIIHTYLINMARPEMYESILNKMLRTNGLPPVNVPLEVPSEDLVGVKVMTGVGTAASQESVTTGVSGFQEEG